MNQPKQIEAAKMTRTAALAQATRYHDSGAFDAQLAALVAHPTESQTANNQAALHAYLDQMIMPRLTASGFDCQIFDNPDPHGGPFLIARRIENPDLPTVWVPHSYRGCSQHAPGEHMLRDVAREGLEMMAGLWWDIGERGAIL